MNENPLDWLGLSGIVAALGGVFGYGRLNEKIESHGAKINKLEADAPTLIRLDERVSTMQDDLAEIKTHLLRK